MDMTKYLLTFTTIPIFDEQQASSIKKIKNSYKILSSKLEIIKDLKINDKLGCDSSGNYYIDEYQWGQFIIRKWSGQSREKTSGDLKRDFSELMKVFDNYLEYIATSNGLMVALYEEQRLLTKEILDFVSNMVQGLYILKKTYPDTVEIKCRVDSIIITLCEFKDRLSGTIEKNQLSRIRALSR
jgi:hypothetical protein